MVSEVSVRVVRRAALEEVSSKMSRRSFSVAETTRREERSMARRDVEAGATKVVSDFYTPQIVPWTPTRCDLR